MDEIEIATLFVDVLVIFFVGWAWAGRQRGVL